MSDHSPFGFGKFIPGFDFLQNLAQGGQSPSGMASPMSHWVAPTVSVEEIGKRIEELKAVQFWLEQNSRALAATVQALEVQKMTLSTLQGMNVSMSDLAKAFTGAAAAPAGAAAPTAAAGHADWPMSSSSAAASKKTGAPQAEPERSKATSDAQSQEQAKATASSAGPADAGAGAAAGAGMGDPMLWWGALSQQFQQIASQALQDPAQQQAMAQATHMASDFTKAAMNAASSMVRQASEGVKAASTAAHSAAPKAAKPKAQAAQADAAPAAAKPAAAKRPAAKRAASAPAAPKATTSRTGTAARKRSR